MRQQAVAARLRQQLDVLLAQVELGHVDQHHGGIAACGGGDHVAVYCSWPGASAMMNLRVRVAK